MIQGNGPSTHSYNRWRKWIQTDEQWQVTVIDTTNLSIDQTLDIVAEWVKSEKQKVPLLSSETQWWK
ncbi:MAG: hypothetical protein ACXAB4_10410 [Candidatus Hodarchaeales archaeon]